MMLEGVLWGVLLGCCLSAVVAVIASIHADNRARRRTLPPATRKQIRRAARANRADIRIVDVAPWARGRLAIAQDDIPPANGDFDNEDTR